MSAMKLKRQFVMAALAGVLISGPAAAGSRADLRSPGVGIVPVKALCGWYVILGCHGNKAAARRLMDELGGPGAGGGTGLRVLNTNEYPNLNDGYYCVGDGPYANRSQAAGIAWAEAVPDAYVKRGC